MPARKIGLAFVASEAGFKMPHIVGRIPTLAASPDVSVDVAASHRHPWQ